MRRIQSWSEKLGKQNLPTPTSEKKKTSLRAWSRMHISKSIIENGFKFCQELNRFLLLLVLDITASFL